MRSFFHTIFRSHVLVLSESESPPFCHDFFLSQSPLVLGTGIPGLKSVARQVKWQHLRSAHGWNWFEWRCFSSIRILCDMGWKIHGTSNKKIQFFLKHQLFTKTSMKWLPVTSWQKRRIMGGNYCRSRTVEFFSLKCLLDRAYGGNGLMTCLLLLDIIFTGWYLIRCQSISVN